MRITQYLVLKTYLPINRITKVKNDENRVFTTSFLEKKEYNFMMKYR